MNPLVSILIPVYNREYLVGETIESALNQTYRNTEVIIVDNCSTDGTWELLKGYEKKDTRIKIFKNTENVGPVLNWKRCMEEAKGEYAKILFSDDLISENFIEETLAVFDEETAFVITNVNTFTEKGIINENLISKNKTISKEKYLKDILFFNYYKFPVSPGASIFRLRDLKKALIIDIPNSLNLDFKKFGSGNDLLLFLNTVIQYKQIKVTVNTTSFFRSHNGSFTLTNRLTVYYDFTKYYFISLYFPKAMSKFKTVLWLKMNRCKQSKPIFMLIRERINILFLVDLVSNKILKKMVNNF